MSLFLRLGLVALAGVLIMGARAATRHCISLQPTKVMAPLAQLPGIYGYSYSSFPLSKRAAPYEKPLLPAAGQ